MELAKIIAQVKKQATKNKMKNMTMFSKVSGPI